MATDDTCCTIVPYFKVRPGKLHLYKALCQRFVEKASTEPKCLYYGFSFDGDEAFCREGYADAEGALAHTENVKDLLVEAAELVDTTRFEIHGPAAELARLRAAFAQRDVQFFTLEYGFRR